MPATIYCPYTDLDIPESESNKEHIIPLSLGGSNGFCLPVSRSYNSDVGSKIDGDLANDLLILFRRRQFDAKGHSGKEAKILSKRSKAVVSDRPLQIEFGGEQGLKFYDPIERRVLSEEETAGKEFSSEFKMSQHGRLRFAAKVALAGGYFVFGDWFRQNVSHTGLRALMNFGPSSKPEDLEGLRAYDEFSPTNEGDAEQRGLDNAFCEAIQGSCVYFIPGPVNIGIIVGVLGKHVATLNVPANTEEFPHSIENDLGHAVVIQGKKVERMSYRGLAQQVYARLFPEQ